MVKVNNKLYLEDLDAIKNSNLHWENLKHKNILINGDNDVLEDAVIYYNSSLKPETFICFEANITADGTNFDIIPLNAPLNTTVILGVYNANKLVDIQYAPYIGKSVPLSTNENVQVAKIFLWNSFSSTTPLCKAVEISNE